MKSKLSVLVLVVVLAALAATPIAASPLAALCAPGAAYNPTCDVNQDGVVNVLDIQLTAGHWNQTGTFTSDNNHNHLGQTWTGANNPLKI
jgi:type 1 fimbria pilin